MRLWRVAPIRLTFVCLVPLIFEALFQLIPILGVPISKVAVPFLASGIWVVLDSSWNSGQFEWRGLLWSLERRNRVRALQFALIMASVFVLQLLVATAVYGPAAFDAVLLGHVQEHPEFLTQDFVLVLILPGMLPFALFTFAGPLFVVGGRGPIEAAKTSVLRMLSSPGALGITLSITCALMTISLLWGYGLLLLLFLPWMAMMEYMAYRDVWPSVSR